MDSSIRSVFARNGLEGWPDFFTTLCDEGVSYGDYRDQFTYPLFFKMAYEYAKPRHTRDEMNER